MVIFQIFISHYLLLFQKLCKGIDRKGEPRRKLSEHLALWEQAQTTEPDADPGGEHASAVAGERPHDSLANSLDTLPAAPIARLAHICPRDHSWHRLAPEPLPSSPLCREGEMVSGDAGGEDDSG